ncbi:hypothetical protein [Kiritimatiella glycovorans]|uniref:Uncharacterized protein n=1 Tax=Kiritimatiella glycovorans TaxID=1307763 RepID=A0A0G3EG17_9BACT|nr:hypothetical protein [Kiritimatiella glycovorans]AKJ65381.1 hypothetical protein L21SP4_02152 [Kiritimatiella glycovorans]
MNRVDGQVAMKVTPNYSLWWLALLILLLGGLVTTYLAQGVQEGDATSRQPVCLAACVTALLAGLCMIASFAPFLFGVLRGRDGF